MALIGSINEQGELQGQISGARYLTGVITNASAVGGQVVGMRGLKGDKGDQGDTGATGADGQDGADGFSPSASVSKVGDTTTITITDKDGTTTASVYDGKDDVFVAEYGVTTYDEIDDAFIDGKAIILKWQSAGYYRYFPCSVIDTSSSYKLTFLMGKSIAYDVEVNPLTPPLDWSYSSRNLQETLVSGTSIKTINSESLLGSGNIDIQGGGASAFIAEYGVTTYADVKDAYDEDAIIICTVDDNGNTAILQLAYFDDANDMFYFAQPYDEGWHWASIAIDDTWDDGSFYFANTDTATQLRNGLMDALDKQKLDGIASGAEVNVQSDWNQSVNTADDYIKNKPTIPSKTSDLNNDVPFATTDTATTLANGLMSSSDKSKLDGIESGAEENYVTKITQHFISNPSDPQEVYPRSATLDYNAVGINDVELLTKDALGEFNGVCDLDASSKVPKSRLPSTSTPTADEVSEFDSSAHMNSTDMTTGADSELEDFIDGLNVKGGGKETVTATKVGSYYSSGTITAYKIGATVTVKLDGLVLSALSSRTTVAELPAGFRPPTQVFSFLSGYTRGVFVNDDGKVQIETGSAGTYWSSITYVAWN